jgi:spermidine/putrescine transport system permease protein
MATVEARVQGPRPTRRSRGGAFAILFAPVSLLIVLFLVPMLLMFQVSTLVDPFDPDSGSTLQHFANVLTDPLNRKIAVTTFLIASTAMVLMLAIAIPLASFMVFRAGRWELPLLLALVVADELNPVVRIWAWRMILGRQGIVNWFLQTSGITDAPVEWLIFTPFAVVVVLSAGYLTYTTIPIYAAMKAINPALFEASVDLGAGWWTRTRKILIPLAAPGIFVAMILVYVPMLTDFVSPDLVAGTGSTMLGQRVTQLILEGADWGNGSALTFVLLVATVLLSLVAFRLAKLNRIQT